MKVPLEWVKKHPKLEPTTHCQPHPYLLSNSCHTLMWKPQVHYFNQPQKNISRKLIQMERLYLFYVGRYGSAIKDIIEIQSLRSRSHGLNLHLHWHVCVFYQSFAFQHVLFSLCVCVEETQLGFSGVISFLTPRTKWRLILSFSIRNGRDNGQR